MADHPLPGHTPRGPNPPGITPVAAAIWLLYGFIAGVGAALVFLSR